MQLNIAQGHYKSQINTYSQLSCVNLFPEIPEKNAGITKGSLLRTHGIARRNAINSGTAVGRGWHHYSKNDWVFGVFGDKLHLYKTDNFADPIIIGDITGSGYVEMADNGFTLLILVPGVTGYFYDIEDETLTEITDTVFTDFMAEPGGVQSIVEMNSRFIYTTAEEFFVGSLPSVNKGQDFDALDFEDAESSSDPIVAARKVSSELYIFGTETTEIYQNIGGVDFPYQRVRGGTLNIGLVGTQAITTLTNTFYLMGYSQTQRTSVYALSGNRVKRISTQIIDQIIQSYTADEIASTKVWSYTADGHQFVCFNLPDQTLVYDASVPGETPTWHIRKSGESRSRVNDCVTFNNKIIVQDKEDGRIGELSRDVYTEYDELVERSFVPPFIFNETKPIIIKQLDLVCQTGIGSSPYLPEDNPDVNPEVELEMSRDFGNTFASLGKVSMGRQGVFTNKVQWRRLGRSSSATLFRFKTSSPTAVDFTGLFVI